MYTYKITNKIHHEEKNIYELTVEYSNGVKTNIQKQNFGTDQTWESVLRHLENRAQSLSRGETEFSRFEVGVPISYTPTTQEQNHIEANEWMIKANRLEVFQRLIKLGLMAETEKIVTDLKADLIATRKLAYLNLL